MRINDDLSTPIIVRSAQLEWKPSPAPGVDRRMLFRIGGEIARATSIVRYAPGSAFPSHTHTGGEEILVLEGTFQDEHGDYPAGSYFRNPPGTSHIPAAKDGCTIFVRLWQYRSGDQAQITRQPGEGDQVAPRGGADTAIILFDDGYEHIGLEHWMPGEIVTVENPRGLEFLLLDGDLMIGSDEVERHSWGRLPAGESLTARVGPQGARIWLRDAELLHSTVLQLPS